MAEDTPVALHMAGFLTGTSIHVEGDAGDFHFSGQFDLRHHLNNSISPPPMPLPASLLTSPLSHVEHSRVDKDTIVHETVESSPREISAPRDETSLDLFHDVEDRHVHVSVADKCATTRLRSGVITPVDYFGVRQKHVKHSSSELLVSKSRRRRGRRNVMERWFRRRSLPIRPLNSYSFFVMAKWGVAKCGSFKETSKRVREMWHQLSERDKQEYVDMALNDKVRYKKQYALLMRKHKDCVH